MRNILYVFALLPALTSSVATARAQEAALDSAASRGDTVSVVLKQRSIVDIWKECPVVPFPTLDHHLGKVTASIAVYSSLRLFGVGRDVALATVSLAALAFEAVQATFFGETFLHSVMDFVLFSSHVPIYFAEQRRYFESTASTAYVVTFYITLLEANE